MADKIKLTPAQLRAGDPNKELEKFLSGHARFGYEDYTYALVFGGPLRSREERLIIAADQLGLSTFSSGLFSYFELAPEQASSGIEAFEELGLPEFRSVVEQGLILLSLDPKASAAEIYSAAKQILQDDVERFLEEAKPLEEFIYENISVLSLAISDYIKQNAAKLRRSPP